MKNFLTSLTDKVPNNTDEHFENLLALSDSSTSFELGPALQKIIKTYTQYKSLIRAYEGTVRSNPDDVESALLLKALKENFDLSPIIKRLDHTLSRIKAKGFYIATSDSTIMPDEGFYLTDGRYTLSTQLLMILAENIDAAVCFDISDDCWYKAIEHTMLLRHPDVLFSVGPDMPMFAPYLKDALLEEILCNLHLLASLDYKQKEIPLLLEKNDKLTRTNEDLVAELEQRKLSDTKLRTEIERLKAVALTASEIKENAHQEQLAMLRQFKKEQKKQQARENQLRQQIAKLEVENQKLKELQQATDAAVIEAAYLDSIALPDKRILFVGGPGHILQKLRKLYPNWIYIQDSHSKAGVPSNVDMAFFWINGIAHPLLANIITALPESTPAAYVEACNLTLLERQMKQNYLRLKTPRQ